MLNNHITLALLILFTVTACGGGGGGGSGGGGPDISASEITLEQGDFSVREIQLKRNRRFRIEGCPAGVCSQHIVDFGVTNTTDVYKMEVKFFTTNETPTGTYNIRLVSYTGGHSCGVFLFTLICTDEPEKILALWQIQLQIVEGGLTFDSNSLFNSSGSPVSIEVVDVNMDGLLDIVTLNHDAPSHSNVSVFFARADGGFEPEVVIAVMEQPASDFLVVDLDEDDVIDLVVTYGSQHGNPPGIFIYKGITPTEFESGNSYSIVHPEYQTWVAWYPHYVDIDSDGARELVVGVNWSPTPPSGGVVIMENIDGEFELDRFHSYASGASQLKALEIFDVNGDERLDLVFLVSPGQTYHGFDPALEIVHSKEGGGFSSSSDIYEVHGLPTSLIVADLNNDTLADVVIGTGEAVNVRTGVGNGLFDDSSRAASVGARVQAMATGDFDGDGILDLLTVNPGSLSVLIGDGVGGFYAPSAVSAPGEVNDVAAADFNGDSRLDFVVTDFRNSQIRMYLQ